jgi:Raf kinase inhibitor-like YbhB/YbcL family protein
VLFRSPTLTEAAPAFELTSPAFTPGNPIPAQFTCSGENVSPQLEWSAPPAGTQSLALILDDPDAPGGTFTHWVLYDIPAAARGLAENVPGDERLADGSLNGVNSAGKPGYTGPCPPSGRHRYFFKLYALDSQPASSSGMNAAQLVQAMQSHVLGTAGLMGTYGR